MCCCFFLFVVSLVYLGSGGFALWGRTRVYE